MPGADLQPAYVLHTRRFRESSLVVELLTRGHGRKAVLAKGALGSRGAKHATLQPFLPLLVDWRGRGELPLLTECETTASAGLLSGRALFCGMYVNELVLRLCEREDPHSTLFPAYAACLHRLGAVPTGENAQLEPVLRQFELALLDELGIGLQLEQDQSGAPIEPDRRYHYAMEAGPVAVADEQAGYSGAALLALAANRLDNPALRIEARQLMRQVLDAHLGGRPLKSRELFI